MSSRAPKRLLLLAALVAGALLPGVAARAVPAPPDNPDFATQTYGDAWDYSNPEDFGGPLRGWTTNASNIAVQNGWLSMEMGSMGELALVRGFGSISIPWGRDGSAHPIPADTYTRLSFSLNAQINAPTGGQITWMTCGTLAQSCEGGQPITINPGWNTYDVELRNGYSSLPSAWSGAVQSLTLVPIGGNTSSAHVDIDWVRLYQPNVAAPASPVSQLAPDPADGSDYASIVRGDPWDFAQSTDVDTVRNANVSFDGQVLHGQNAAPSINDPFLILPTPAPFSGTRFHRFSMRVFYDGVFSLKDNVGGGMNARVLWNIAGSDVQQISQDILIYPGWQTINFDMNWPNIIDETQPGARLGWAGQTITSFRIDPDEDRGGRSFMIDWVKLGSDRPFGSLDVVRRVPGGVYVAGWSIDPNSTDPTGIRLFVDTLRYTANPAGMVRPDIGTRYPAFGSAHGFAAVIPASVGGHKVCAWAINIGPGGHGLLGCQQVVIDGMPYGSLDIVNRVADGYSVAGWTIDPDTASPIAVHVYVDNVGVSLGNASGQRLDVAGAHPGYGANHGFAATVAASGGTHTVCAYAINDAGPNPALGCRVA